MQNREDFESHCESCGKFKEVNGKVNILLWIFGIASSFIVGCIAWGNMELRAMNTAVRTVIPDVQRRVHVLEEENLKNREFTGRFKHFMQSQKP
jgi:hypothetical protein